MKDLNLLLKAVDYLEKNEKHCRIDTDHEYAMPAPIKLKTALKTTSISDSVQLVQPKARYNASKSKKISNIRCQHNEMEKRRRAQLRLSFEDLRKLINSNGGSTRSSNLSILLEAHKIIKRMVHEDKQKKSILLEMQREEILLKKKMDQLTRFRFRCHHSISSECSSSSSATTSISPDSDIINCDMSDDDTVSTMKLTMEDISFQHL